MEEHIGQLWHRLITRAAATDHPAAAVTLEQVERPVGMLFRALGGDGGLQVTNASATAHGARRNWLQRLAGSHRQVQLAWCDEQTLRLPERIALFPEIALNRDLYLWLAALNANYPRHAADWFGASQHACRRVLERLPGLRERYRRLVEAHLARRPDPACLPADEAAQEHAIRAALLDPGSMPALPRARRPAQPVPLWPHPSPPLPAAANRPADEPEPERGAADRRQQQDRKRRRAERVEDADGRHGLLAFRLESLFSWAEYVPVDRTADEDDADARRVADDLEVLSLARDRRRTTAARLRFDLDLPAAAADDTPLGPGLRLPEWDYRRGAYRPDYCLLQPMLPARAEPAELPPHLRAPARRLRRQFQALMPRKHWRRGEPDGTEPDLDAWLCHLSERRRGQASAEPRLYREQRFAQRDLACLLLADLSMSTDSWLDNHHRVIDLIRDSLHLFAEALAGGGDRYALAGFSSRKRGHVRFHPLKDFAEPLSATVRGRIQAIRPGYYTRMGAAIRHASQWLARQPAQQRLLILLSDGKPNDLDHYEGRYGIEDTRMAVLEARRQGLRPFCVTIDKEGNDYLPYLFGQSGYLLIRRPAELPRRLPLLYARLSALARGAG